MNRSTKYNKPQDALHAEPSRTSSTRPIILKFGGASVSTLDDFHFVAKIIAQRKDAGETLAVVISAMANTTESLIAQAHKLAPSPNKRELDMLISTGERVSASLLCIALNANGIQAASFTGSQAGIITTAHEDHVGARIVDVRPQRLLTAWQEGKIPVIAGFQGVSQQYDITTLGRGGSDVTAIALAIALNASKVAFYKDVDAIYSADPKQNPAASPLDTLTHEEALLHLQKSQISPGKAPLHPRSLELAMKHSLPIEVGSFQQPHLFPGTRVSSTNSSTSSKWPGAPCDTLRQISASDFFCYEERL